MCWIYILSYPLLSCDRHRRQISALFSDIWRLFQALQLVNNIIFDSVQMIDGFRGMAIDAFKQNMRFLVMWVEGKYISKRLHRQLVSLCASCSVTVMKLKGHKRQYCRQYVWGFTAVENSRQYQALSQILHHKGGCFSYVQWSIKP